SRHRGIRSSLALGRVFARASQRERSRRSREVNPTPLNDEKVALHFPSAWARPPLEATVRNAISKMKTAECFHSGFATLLRSNPHAGNHRHRDTAACKNIRQAQKLAASRRISRRDV